MGSLEELLAFEEDTKDSYDIKLVGGIEVLEVVGIEKLDAKQFKFFNSRALNDFVHSIVTTFHTFSS